MREHIRRKEKSMSSSDTTGALTAIIDVLKPLNSDERHRTVNAAMLFLGETTGADVGKGKAAGAGLTAGEDVDDGDFTPTAVAWMRKHGVSAEEMWHVFHFNNDGSFDIHEVPGKYKSEKTLNAYTLTGLAKYLTKNER